MNKYATAVLAASLGCAVSAQAVAQAADTTTQSNENTQTTNTDDVIDVVVSATRMPTPVSKVGSSVSVISSKEIESTGKTRIPDLLRYVPSMDVIQNGGTGQTSTVFIRGAKSEHTLVMVDGIEMSDPSSTTRLFNFGDIDTSNIERIEVIRGPQSTLYGSDAIGGVINIITKKGKGKPKAYGSFEFGSYNTRKEKAGFSGTKGMFDFSLSAAHESTDGFSAADSKMTGNNEKDGSESTFLSSRIGFAPTDNFDAELVLRHTKSDTDIDNGNGNNNDDLNYTAQNEQFAIRGQGRLLLLDDMWEQIAGVSYMDIQRDLDNTVDAAQPSNALLGRYSGEILKADWQHNLYVNDANTITLGLENERETYSSYVYSKSTWSTTTTHTPEKAADTNSVFAQYMLDTQAGFTGTAGVRHDNHDRFGGETTWRLAPVYTHDKTGTRLHASYGTGVKAPSLFQLYSSYGNPDVMPEKSRSWDIGIDQEFANGKYKLGVTRFKNTFTNMIDFANNTYNNVDKAHTDGYEITAKADITKSLTADIAYSILNTEDENTGEELVRRADYRVRASIDWAFIKNASARLDMFLVGEREDQFWNSATFATQRVQLDDYFKADIAVNGDVNDTFTLYGRIENITDTNYQDAYGYGTAGRSVYAGVKARF